MSQTGDMQISPPGRFALVLPPHKPGQHHAHRKDQGNGHFPPTNQQIDCAARELSLATLKAIFTRGSDGLLVQCIILVPLTAISKGPGRVLQQRPGQEAQERTP